MKIILKYSDSLHWPDKAMWKEYSRKRKKGKEVIVFYDPDETNKCIIYFVD